MHEEPRERTDPQPAEAAAVARLLLELRPQRIYAAVYEPLPFPHVGVHQEFAFDLGVTSLDAELLLAGIVIRGYREHQLLFEQRWPMQVIQQQTGESDLTIAAGSGLAVRTLHFMLHGHERLTHVDLTAVARDTQGGRVEGRVQAPVYYPEQKTDLRLPVEGSWWVIQAADWSDAHKQEVVSQPFAADFVRLGDDARFFSDAGTTLEDHYSWNQPVHAAAGGKIAFVQYDMPDLAPGLTPDPRIYRDDPRRLLGNAVAVSHGNGEFSYYAHLQQASLAVNQGQVVRRGALLGRVGNSGNSPGPHLHVHLMEGPNAYLDQGLPMRFSHFSAGGAFYNRPTFLPTRMIVHGPAIDGRTSD